MRLAIRIVTSFFYAIYSLQTQLNLLLNTKCLTLWLTVLGGGYTAAAWQQGTGPESRGVRLCCFKPVHRHHQHFSLYSCNYWKSKGELRNPNF